MKQILLFLSLTILLAPMNAENIFLSTQYYTDDDLIPFDRITNADFEPAINAGIAEQNKEIDAITKQRSTPTFENTIVALERSGETLNRVLSVFYPYLSANCDDELMQISAKVTPALTAHSTSVYLNEQLWARVKHVYDNRGKIELTAEDNMLLDDTYSAFERNGANLTGDDRERFRQLSSEISSLSLQFGQNVLKEINSIEVWLEEDDLEGLPQSAIDAARTAAAAKGRDDAYLITMHAPSYSVFMKYSARRHLREKVYKLYNSRNTAGEYSNVELIKELSYKRYQLAKLLGYDNYAEYTLKRKMAQNAKNVYNLLDQLRDAYLPVQKSDMEELQNFASQMEGEPVTIEAWDYSYYNNKLKDSRYELNDELLRPYFELSSVIDGVFGLATKLYGLHFTLIEGAPVFHPQVSAYRVTDEAGGYVGVIYTDFFPRDTKRSGAWMTCFREQSIDDNGNNIRPIVTITMNFTRPTEEAPSLLLYSEVETFLHEFGHAIHGLLANTRYQSLSGTNVYRDFVELPSQFNENFLSQKEFLDSFARHYITGETIPQELIDKITATTQFGAAYSCVRQLNFGYLDMAWHTITEPVTDAAAFEAQAVESVLIFPNPEGCLFSPQFSHIFSGGYAAGYYSYKWSEVLDADAFAKFEEDGIFNPATAKSFKDNILTRGGTEPPLTLYKRFRGSEPTIDALLRRDGITSAQ